MPDGVCNPVRNVFNLYAGRGLQPRPAQYYSAGRGLQPRPQRFISKTLRTGLQTPSSTIFMPDGVCNPVRNVLPDGVCNPVRNVSSLPDGVCNPVRNVLPDGVCNPVRNVSSLKRYGRGSRREERTSPSGTIISSFPTQLFNISNKRYRAKSAIQVAIDDI
jgi:hypothetical protein